MTTSGPTAGRRAYPSIVTPRQLLVFLATQVGLTLLAWVWCFIAWSTLPDVSGGSIARQERAILVRSNLPVFVLGGSALFVAVLFVIDLIKRRDFWLAVVVVVMQVPVQFAIVVASAAFINFKPPGW